MHRIAEQGVAAHWRYKDGTNPSEDDQRVVWMRQLIEWAREMREPAEFLSTLKVDLYPEEVYTFTPKGKVLTLPRGATPVDFAYSIHTDVGHQCVGAKVNGQMVPLRHPLSNGDVVEIATQKGHGPSRDWLSFVRTSRARSKIPPFWFLARTISWFIAPNAVIRSRATPSSAMSQGAAESPCITPLVPTCRSCSINPNAASTCNGAMWDREPIPSRWWCTARIVPDFSLILPA